MRTAFVLGGTGFIGPHVAARLVAAGWEVTVGSRGQTAIPEGVGGRHVLVDRSVEGSLRSSLKDGFDVLIDVIPYEPTHADQLLAVEDLVGSIVAISTCSVYADDQGRTLDEAASVDDLPMMPVPIHEDQRRAAPGDESYSTRKALIEDVLLEQDDLPAVVIRPCAIYGPGDTQCREWFFIKRVLDGRRHVLLVDEGRSTFHTTSVHNLAELVRLAAEKPVHGAFNCGDPDPPNAKQIARSIAHAMNHDWEEVLVPACEPSAESLRHPWAAQNPWVVAMDKARELFGYEPVTRYEDAIGETVKWVVEVTRDGDWRDVLPKAATYLGPKFDYAAEDTYLASRRGP